MTEEKIFEKIKQLLEVKDEHSPAIEEFSNSPIAFVSLLTKKYGELQLTVKEKTLLLEGISHLLPSVPSMTLWQAEQHLFSAFSNEVPALLKTQNHFEPDTSFEAHNKVILFLNNVISFITPLSGNETKLKDKGTEQTTHGDGEGTNICNMNHLREMILSTCVVIFGQCRKFVSSENSKQDEYKVTRESINNIYRQIMSIMKSYVDLFKDNSVKASSDSLIAFLQSLEEICSLCDLDIKLLNECWKYILTIMKQCKETLSDSKQASKLVNGVLHTNIMLGIIRTFGLIPLGQLDQLNQDGNVKSFLRELKILRFYFSNLYALLKDYPDDVTLSLPKLLDIVLLSQSFGKFPLYSELYAESCVKHLDQFLLSAIDKLLSFAKQHREAYASALLHYVPVLPVIGGNQSDLNAQELILSKDCFDISGAYEYTYILILCNFLGDEANSQSFPKCVSKIVNFITKYENLFSVSFSCFEGPNKPLSLYDYILESFHCYIKRWFETGSALENNKEWESAIQSAEDFLFSQVINDNCVLSCLVCDTWIHFARFISFQGVISHIKLLLYLKQELGSRERFTFSYTFISKLVTTLLISMGSEKVIVGSLNGALKSLKQISGQFQDFAHTFDEMRTEEKLTTLQDLSYIYNCQNYFSVQDFPHVMRQLEFAKQQVESSLTFCEYLLTNEKYLSKGVLFQGAIVLLESIVNFLKRNSEVSSKSISLVLLMLENFRELEQQDNKPTTFYYVLCRLLYSFNGFIDRSQMKQQILSEIQTLSIAIFNESSTDVQLRQFVLQCLRPLRSFLELDNLPPNFKKRELFKSLMCTSEGSNLKTYKRLKILKINQKEMITQLPASPLAAAKTKDNLKRKAEHNVEPKNFTEAIGIIRESLSYVKALNYKPGSTEEYAVIKEQMMELENEITFINKKMLISW